MDLFGIGPIADLANKVLSFIPDAKQRADALNHLQDMAAQIATQQSATNTAEAATGNLFIAGWRPAIGWICVIGFAYTLVQPVLHLPAADTSFIQNVLWAMLGLGTMRTAEKIGGVATNAIKSIVGRK